MQAGASDDQRDPVTFDGSTGKADPPPGAGRYKLDLDSLRGIRIEMARLYRQVRRGRMASGEMNARIYGLRSIGEMLVAEDFERRIAALEGPRGAAPEEQPRLRAVA